MSKRLTVCTVGEGALIESEYADAMTPEEAAIHRRLDEIIDIKKPLIP